MTRGGLSALLFLGLGLGCDWSSDLSGLTTAAETDGTDTDEGDSTSGEGSASGGTSGGSSASTTMSSGDSDDDDPTASSSTTTTTSSPSTTNSSDSGDDTGTEPGPLACSVEAVTQGALVDPMGRGNGAGVFPPEVADALEDLCGCHTLMSNAQNLEWPSLLAPGGSLFLEYSDLNRSLGGSTLGAAIRAEVEQLAMPPGSCPYPSGPAAVLSNWFAQGMPDGANYDP
jgi:hypothetical protein